MPRIIHAGLPGVVLALAAAGTPACGCGPDLNRLAADAVSDDAAVAGAAIEVLRASGPRGLEALLRVHGDGAGSRLARVLDAVGGQCDNHAARLYWYTDLDAALAEARRTGRPILSLRLLGRLDEELSCANSRFLRTAIYANAEISSMLRDRFVLHWKSVRPVPKITIDFGDGRRIVRTITGNSLHYVLDADGRPLDALPGLCGPAPFRRWLQRTSDLAARVASIQQNARDRWVRRYHNARYAWIVRAWNADAQRDPTPGQRRVERFPDALAAAPVAKTKAGLELPVLAAMASDADRLERETDHADWSWFGELHAGAGQLDAASRALMARKTGTTPAMIERFEASLALDTVRNEYLYHRRIHAWFIEKEIGELEALTERIYGELFLTPSEDPWLGLLAEDTYAALDGNGVRRTDEAPE